MLTKEQKFILFGLGTCNTEFSKKMADKPLEFSISKTAFIELAMNSGIVKKHERALYKNLEDLENQKCLTYENKTLKLTDKGMKLYEKINNELSPCLNVLNLVKQSNILRYTSKARTTLKI